MFAYDIILLVVGLLFVVFGADYFVAGSSLIAKKFEIPKLIIGLTIVALGTSAPEFGVNIISSIQGHSSLALGNILGSNISNILLIFAGAVLFIKKVEISKNSLTQVSLSLLIAFVLLTLGMFSFNSDLKILTKIEGLILVLVGGFYWLYLYKITKANSERLEDEDIVDNKLKKISSLAVLFGITLISLVALLFGSNLITNSAVSIAKLFNLSELVIAGTIVALGTSLPELVTSIQAVRQKQFNLMIGNIVGSNIINTLFILGVSILINNIPIDKEAILYLHMNGIASGILLVGFTIFVPREFKKWQAFVLLGFYLIFLILTFW